MREEREENSESKKTLSGLLKESMMRNNVKCIEVPSETGSVFVSLSTSVPSVPPLKKEEDILKIIDGVCGLLLNTPHSDIPDTVVRIVAKRMEERRGDINAKEPCIKIVQRPVKGNTLRVTSATNETQQLTRQFVKTYNEARVTQRMLKPYKDEQKLAEKNALDVVNQPITVKVQKNGNEHHIRVLKCERRTKTCTHTIGVRKFLMICRDAATSISHVESSPLDFLFREEVLRQCRLLFVPKPTEHYIKVLKV